MARPLKTGLDYFPFDVDFHDDFKIMDLLNEYGPLGCMIYEITLCKVYKNGYYLEVSLEKLATQIIRIIGNRWIKEKNLVLQVILYCADIGLFDHALLTQSVITSVGIQRRYSEVTVRNKVNKSKYWLLEKENVHAALESAPFDDVSVTKTPVSVTKTPVSATETQQKKSKLNESKLNKTARAREAFSLLLDDGQKLTVSEDEILNFEKIYPKLNVRLEFVNMQTWLEKNPNGRRSIGKTRRFIENWLYRKARGEDYGQDKRDSAGDSESPAAYYHGTTYL